MAQKKLKEKLRNAIVKWVAKNHPGFNLNFTIQDADIFDKALKPINEELEILHTSCQEALDDEWDRSDDGFRAMQDNIEEIQIYIS